MLANHATRHHAGNAAEPGDTKVPCIKLEKTKDRRSIHQKDGESSAIYFNNLCETRALLSLEPFNHLDRQGQRAQGPLKAAQWPGFNGY